MSRARGWIAVFGGEPFAPLVQAQWRTGEQSRCLAAKDLRGAAQDVQDLRARLSIARQGIAQQCPERGHVDVKYLPQMADESSRRYLFVAIDPLPGSGLPANHERGATRWVFIRICKSRTAANARRQCPPPMPAACLARSAPGLPDPDRQDIDPLSAIASNHLPVAWQGMFTCPRRGQRIMEKSSPTGSSPHGRAPRPASTSSISSAPSSASNTASRHRNHPRPMALLSVPLGECSHSPADQRIASNHLAGQRVERFNGRSSDVPRTNRSTAPLTSSRP